MSEENTVDTTAENAVDNTENLETTAEDSVENTEETLERPEQSEEDLARAADVREFMYDVIDPELGINVVDLGLVYDIWIKDENEAVVNMTLTSPACPLTDVLEDQAEAAVVGQAGIDKLTLNWVWTPPWGPQMITEDGREQLRALGFSV